MTSAPVRDPLTDHLITPQNAALLLIDYQPAQLAGVRSMDRAHLALARLIGHQALTGLTLAHGYDTAFWWTAGIFAGGAVIAGALLRPGPLDQQGTPSQAHGKVPTAQATAGPARPA
jgi:nicotinamidase-related amidase